VENPEVSPPHTPRVLLHRRSLTNGGSITNNNTSTFLVGAQFLCTSVCVEFTPTEKASKMAVALDSSRKVITFSLGRNKEATK